MFSSVFRKFLFTYLSIAFISLLAISILIAFLLHRQIYHEKEQMLLSNAKRVSKLSTQMVEKEITRKDFRKNLNWIEKATNSQVSIIGRRNLNANDRKLLTVGKRPDIRNWVLNVLSGQKEIERSTLRKNESVKMLIVGQPIQNANQKIVGAVFLYTPIRNIKAITKSINHIIFLSALATAIPVLLILYFASRRFTRPIEKMNRHAKEVAKGHFGVRVPVSGKDELAKLSAAFNQMTAKLENVEASRKKLLSEISHEMRTPLTSLRASLQGLVDGVVEKQDERRYLNLSLYETKRLGKLVEDLMQLSAFEEKQVTLLKKRVNLSELVNETVMQFRTNADQKSLSLQTEVEKNCFCEVDRDRIKQVLINLLENAIRHTPEGGQINVSLSGNDEAKITLSDSGEGISEEKLPNIFNRFYKADESRSVNGAGLGLTICRYIVEAHGGTIQAASKRGKGTTFSIQLPLVTYS